MPEKPTDTEYVQMPFFRDRIPTDKPGLFIDLGSYQGEVSAYVLNHTELDVLAVDIDICATRDELMKWPDRVVTMEGAISTRYGVTRFYNEGEARSIFHDKSGGEKKPSGMVPQIKLFDLLLSMAEQYEFIVVKMDIEGKEYDVIPDLAQNGGINIPDLWFVDWHYAIMNIPYDEHCHSLCNFRKLKATSHHWYPGGKTESINE